ncbi:MAG: hypothetical protein KA764_09905 [Anaerolineales bacterium]|nr:hypothetical protein [Anaerolineales bacterium]
MTAGLLDWGHGPDPPDRLCPADPLPELDEFLSLFRFKFRRPEGRRAAERYLLELLTEHPNKNCGTLAAVVWDETDLNRHRVQILRALPTGVGV